MKIKRTHTLWGIGAGLAVFFGGMWASPLPLVTQICLDASIPLTERLALSSHLLSSSFSDIALTDMLYLAASAILIGINLSLALAYIRIRRQRANSAGVASGFFGTLVSILGLGCAACGSLALSPLLVTIGAGGLLASLPFGGEELKYIGIVLLIVSAYLLTRDLKKPAVCAD